MTQIIAMAGPRTKLTFTFVSYLVVFSSMASMLILALLTLLSSCTGVDGALAWGTFLGADWDIGEEYLRNELSIYLKNTQRICQMDVEKLCLHGKHITAQTSTYTYWISSTYKRHSYKEWFDVPLGFGNDCDVCFRDVYDQYKTGISKRLIPKCVDWIEKTEGQYDKIRIREKGNDRRELFVMFSTIFATSVSGGLGYLLGLFQKERNDLFSYHNRHENKKILIFFGIVTSIPVVVILLACPRLLVIMMITAGIGRGAQYYIQMKEELAYSRVSGSDSGIVFAAVPLS